MFASASLLLDVFFFFNDTATTEIYTLSLHDALPIWAGGAAGRQGAGPLPPRYPDDRAGLAADGHARGERGRLLLHPEADRKSTRLNSSHANISYAVFCLKKKNQTTHHCTHDVTSLT